MARLLPADAAPPANPIAARLEALLASLPDEWTLIPDRHIGGRDGPHVGFVLLHPEIGIALVDLEPGRPEAGIRPLVALLVENGLPAAELPVVAAALAADEIEDVGQRLAAAFEAAPPCSIEERDWPDRVAGLMLAAEDAAMAPIATHAPKRVDAAWQPRIDPEDAVELHPAPPRRGKLRWAAGIAAVTVAALGLGAGIDVLTRSPPQLATARSDVAPAPQAAPAHQVPPSGSAEVATGTPPVPPAPQLAPTKPRIAEVPTPSPKPPSPAPNAPPVADVSPAPQAPPPPPEPATAQASPAPSETPPAPAATPPARPTPAVQPGAPAPATPAAAAAKPPAAPAPPAAKLPAALKPTKQVAVRTPPKPMKTIESKPTEAKSAEVRSNPSPASTGDGDGPPIDAADLPPLEGAEPRAPLPPVRQIATLPPGAPVPLPTPYSGVPAPGQPIMLLPPVAPPAAMPPPPTSGTSIAPASGDGSY